MFTLKPEITELIQTLPRFNLRGRQLYDLELLMVGGFTPLSGFMNLGDYKRVLREMRLADGTLFPVPIVLDVPDSFTYQVGEHVLLCDQWGDPLALMSIESRFTPNKHEEALHVYGSTDGAHPGVHYLMHEMYDTYLGGPVTPIALPKRNDFVQFRKTPADIKKLREENGWDKLIGFQTRNPMHRAHFELVQRAHEKIGAPVLIHPVVGMTMPGDIDYVTRVRTYTVVCNTYGKDFTHLALLPLAMRMAGPREALWHAIIRKNYGCTHFIVGRDHSSPGNDSAGKFFYGPYEARELAKKYAEELGIEIVASDELVYTPSRKIYVSSDELEPGEKVETISGTEFRRRLRAGEEIPEWFSFGEIITILREVVKRDTRRGVTLLFTGLPCAGKSTTAELLLARLQEIQDRSITFLDGDAVRQNLSKGLGFSKEDRNENVRRVGFVAGEVTKHGGIALCALIAPYRRARHDMRALIEQYGIFIEVHVATSLAVCESRDTKGLYAKARKGEIAHFTGISDPYEKSENPELTFDTDGRNPRDIVDEIVDYLKHCGIL